MTKSSSVLKFDSTFNIFTRERRRLEVGIKVYYYADVKISLGHFKFYGLFNENTTSITQQNIKKILLIPPRVEFTLYEFRILQAMVPQILEYSDNQVRFSIGQFNFCSQLIEKISPVISFRANEIDWLTHRVPPSFEFTMDEFRQLTYRMDEIIKSATFHEDLAKKYPNSYHRM
jgi:hypothetical protein